MRANDAASRPGAASCPRTACAHACAGARRAAWHDRPDPPSAIAAWSRCSPTRTRIGAADTRGSASRSSPRGGSGTRRIQILLVDRHPPHRCPAKAAIRKSGLPFLLIAAPVTPELPLRHPKISPASCAESSLCSQRVNTSANFFILRSCSHVVRFIVPPLSPQGHKTGQLVCYLTRTTHELTTVTMRGIAGTTQKFYYDLSNERLIASHFCSRGHERI